VQTQNIDGSAAAPSYSFGNDPDTGMYRYGGDGVGFATNGVARVAIDNNGTYFSDGTAALPGLSFLADGNTGFYRAVADKITWSGGGAAAGNLSSNGVEVIDGSAATPAYAFTNDLDTGLYRVSTNDLGIAAGGALIAEFYSGGLYFGAGSTTIQARDGAVGGPAYSFSGDTDTGMYRVGADSLGITTGGTNRATVSNSGVIIGAPTGGAQGDGTINATALYVNGVSVGAASADTNSATASDNIAGCTNSGSISFSRAGNTVSMRLPSTPLGCSGYTGSLIQCAQYNVTYPSGFAPTVSQEFPTTITNAGVMVPGLLLINTSNNIQFCLLSGDFSQSTFQLQSQIAGTHPPTFTYIKN
jgi:hypothetical protein